MSAFRILLKAFPADFAVPLALVLHRETGHEDILVKVLQKSSRLVVVEVEDKQSIIPGHVFVAPAGYHMLVEKDHLALSTDAPVLYARPSIDVLLESAADSFGDQVVGVILTGASEDGAQGLAAIKRKGGMTVVQDPSTADAPTMPEAAIAASTVDMILPLKEMGPFLVNIVTTGRRHGTQRKSEHSPSR
jgi:two-component system chemotaxis response regulator CheB